MIPLAPWITMLATWNKISPKDRRDITLDMNGVLSTHMGIRQEFKTIRDLYRYYHRCFRELRRFSNGKPFKNDRDATLDSQCALLALIWAKEADPKTFWSVYSHYR